MGIHVQLVTDLDNIRRIREVQRRVWGSEPDDILPTHVPVAVIMSGGGLVCAYDDDGPSELGGMVGYAFWWMGVGVDPEEPADSPPKVKACSHMAGVLPEWQGKGIGARLKLAQAQAVRDQGVTDWITWTYDPLYRGNAAFNIRRLGATSCTFHRDIYGDLPDAINAGWPSDRVTVDWRINSPDILRSVDQPRPEISWDPASMLVPEVMLNEAGLPLPPDQPLTYNGQPVAIPLPTRMSDVRAVDKDLALGWRYYMRETLETAFGAGYRIVDCVNLAEYGWRYIVTPRDNDA